MATEIERKFLLADDGWRTQCVRSERLRDGLIAITGMGVAAGVFTVFTPG